MTFLVTIAVFRLTDEVGPIFFESGVSVGGFSSICSARGAQGLHAFERSLEWPRKGSSRTLSHCRNYCVFPLNEIFIHRARHVSSPGGLNT